MANAKPKAITSAKKPSAAVPTAAKASRKDASKTAPEATGAVAYPLKKAGAMQTQSAATGSSFASLMGMTRGGGSVSRNSGKAPKKSK